MMCKSTLIFRIKEIIFHIILYFNIEKGFLIVKYITFLVFYILNK